MSERAQKILTWILNQNSRELPIRQVTLAELFGCSRRTIGRALKELKEGGVLIDLNQRAENRCKLYQVSAQVEKIPTSAPAAERHYPGLTPEWLEQLHERSLGLDPGSSAGVTNQPATWRELLMF